jgi:hypothetical protein
VRQQPGVFPQLSSVNFYLDVRDMLARFAELKKSPGHVHTCRITPLSLWNAASAGLNANAILIEFRDQEALDELRQHPDLKSYLTPFPADNRALAIVPGDQLAEVEAILAQLGCAGAGWVTTLEEQMKQSPDLKVFISSTDSVCAECGEELGRSAWITLIPDKGALCLACADLDHLIFLPSGDAALTRRAHTHSTLTAVVLKWSRARKRYERQGLLVEAEALAQAEQECLADSEARARRREREETRRAELDRQYVDRFAQRVRELFPRCPPEREQVIAEHACLKYSGRVGRSANAKSLDEKAVRLAVVAHIRHTQTPYDALLARGYDRWEARAQVEEAVVRVLGQWESRGSHRGEQSESAT